MGETDFIYLIIYGRGSRSVKFTFCHVALSFREGRTFRFSYNILPGLRQQLQGSNVSHKITKKKVGSAKNTYFYSHFLILGPFTKD